MKNLIKVLSVSLFIFLFIFFQNTHTSSANVSLMQKEEKLNILPKNWKEGETKCSLHNHILKKDEIYITYGEVDGIPGYYKARDKNFPFANSSYLGGRIIQKEKIAVVAYCDKCRKAEKEWTTKNKPKS